MNRPRKKIAHFSTATIVVDCYILFYALMCCYGYVSHYYYYIHYMNFLCTCIPYSVCVKVYSTLLCIIIIIISWHHLFHNYLKSVCHLLCILYS